MSSITSARDTNTAANRASTAASWCPATRMFSLGEMCSGGGSEIIYRGCQGGRQNGQGESEEAGNRDGNSCDVREAAVKKSKLLGAD